MFAVRMGREGVTITREQAYKVLDALRRAVQLTAGKDTLVERLQIEEAYCLMRDATFPETPPN
jgi:hypothetical protein